MIPAKTDTQPPPVSFFDELNKPVTIWQKPTLQDIFKLGVSDIFYKKKSKQNEFQKRYYTLTKECLYYRKVKFLKNFTPPPHNEHNFSDPPPHPSTNKILVPPPPPY